PPANRGHRRPHRPALAATPGPHRRARATHASAGRQRRRQHHPVSRWTDSANGGRPQVARTMRTTATAPKAAMTTPDDASRPVVLEATGVHKSYDADGEPV